MLGHGCFAQGAGNLEGNLITRGSQHNAVLEQRFGLFELVGMTRASDPIILTELLIDAEIAHTLAEHGIWDVLEQIALFGGQVDGVEMVEVVGGAGKL